MFETHARTRPCGQTDVFDHAHLVKRIRGRARAAAERRSAWRQGSGQTVARKAASLARKIAVRLTGERSICDRPAGQADVWLGGRGTSVWANGYVGPRSPTDRAKRKSDAVARSSVKRISDACARSIVKRTSDAVARSSVKRIRDAFARSSVERISDAVARSSVERISDAVASGCELG